MSCERMDFEGLRWTSVEPCICSNDRSCIACVGPISSMFDKWSRIIRTRALVVCGAVAGDAGEERGGSWIRRWCCRSQA